MENLGYKEGSTKPRSNVIRFFSQTDSIFADDEAVPLSSIRPRPNRLILNEEDPCNDNQYLTLGSSPPTEYTPSFVEAFEEPALELNPQLCNDTIRSGLIEQMRTSYSRIKLFEDIEDGSIIAENVIEIFESASQKEKNLCFLWSAFLKRWDLLEGLLQVCAELSYHEQGGFSSIHLAAFSGCLTSVSYLLYRGADVNYQPKYFTPLHCSAFGNAYEAAKLLISHGAKISINTKTRSLEESLLHCAVRANAIECVKLLIDKGADVNALISNGTNAVHLAADLGHVECLEALLEAPSADPNIRICIREKESTALHLAADEGNMQCVSLLLEKGADAKTKNHRGFTALHLAARVSSLECVELILQMSDADPNAEDFDQRTALHAALGKSEQSIDIIEMLVACNADVNHKDIFGYTPVHLAGLEGLTQCVEALIYFGADVTSKSKRGTTALSVIKRKTPTALTMINRKLDAACVLHQVHENFNKEIELELNFTSILEYCHPKEISYLNTFVDEGDKELLEHPVCSAFLYIKWIKIRKYYLARLIFCFLYVLFFTLYVLTALAHNCYNINNTYNKTVNIPNELDELNGTKYGDENVEICQEQSILGDMLRDNPFVINMQWMVLAGLTVIEIIRKGFGITGHSSFRLYVTCTENIIEWYVIISVFVISHIYNNQTYHWQNHIGAFAVLLSWTNLMLMVGQLPIFGLYIAMYTRVQKEFAKLFLAFSCILIGFTFSFCIIFPSSSSFANPFVGFITVLIMMVGELDVNLLINDPKGKDPPFLLEISAQIVFVLFLAFVTVILMNLLVGIAVDDIQELKKKAAVSKLVRQTKLISYIESALFNGWLPKWLRSLLFNTALVSPKASHVVMSVRPMNASEDRLPHDIMMEAYEIANKRQHFDKSVSTETSPSSNKGIFRDKRTNEDDSAIGLERQNDGLDFDTYSVSALQVKVEQSSEKIDKLNGEIKDIKAVLFKNNQTVEDLIVFMKAQKTQKFKEKEFLRKDSQRKL